MSNWRGKKQVREVNVTCKENDKNSTTPLEISIKVVVNTLIEAG